MSAAPPRRANMVGRTALAVSVIGLFCMWAAMPLANSVGCGIVGLVACVAGWILMPVAFTIACAGSLLSGKGKAACTSAIVISTAGSIGSFILLLLGVMLAGVWHYLPN